MYLESGFPGNLDFRKSEIPEMRKSRFSKFINCSEHPEVRISRFSDSWTSRFQDWQTGSKVVARIRSSKAITSSVLSQLFFQSKAAMLSNSKLIHQAITPVPMGSV